jgi:hypothetical protein
VFSLLVTGPSHALTIPEEVECCLYAFVTHLVKDEVDYKRIIGRRILPLCH